MTKVAAPHIDYDGRRLVQGHGRHRPMFATVHDTEGHDWKGITDLAGVATYWHGISWGPGSQVGVDLEGFSARYVDDLEIAYHVQDHNTGNLGIEQIGFATFTAADWLARPKQLDETAHWLAYWNQVYGIPLRPDTEHGVSTHAMQSERHGGTHTDPGRGYPFAHVLELAQAYVDGDLQPKPKPKLTVDDFYLWLRWDLGEGEFAKWGPRSKPHRPKRIPAAVPRAWIPRAEAFVARRKATAARARLA